MRSPPPKKRLYRCLAVGVPCPWPKKLLYKCLAIGGPRPRTQIRQERAAFPKPENLPGHPVHGAWGALRPDLRVRACGLLSVTQGPLLLDFCPGFPKEALAVAPFLILSLNPSLFPPSLLSNGFRLWIPPFCTAQQTDCFNEPRFLERHRFLGHVQVSSTGICVQEKAGPQCTAAGSKSIAMAKRPTRGYKLGRRCGDFGIPRTSVTKDSLSTCVQTHASRRQETAKWHGPAVARLPCTERTGFLGLPKEGAGCFTAFHRPSSRKRQPGMVGPFGWRSWPGRASPKEVHWGFGCRSPSVLEVLRQLVSQKDSM